MEKSNGESESRKKTKTFVPLSSKTVKVESRKWKQKKSKNEGESRKKTNTFVPLSSKTVKVESESRKKARMKVKVERKQRPLRLSVSKY